MLYGQKSVDQALMRIGLNIVIRTDWDRETMAVEKTKAEVTEIISAFLRGDGPPWVWDDFLSVRIKDPSLDAVRVRCAALPDDYPPLVAGHYCGDAGMAILASLADGLRGEVV
jgi:hypothetical protein